MKSRSTVRYVRGSLNDAIRLFGVIVLALVVSGCALRTVADPTLVEDAELGDTHADYLVGLTYLRGMEVERDYTEAMVWLRKAADRGYAPAQYELGLIYAEGSGVERDNAEAIAWFRKAADQGYVMAQRKLGTAQVEGKNEGAPKEQVAAKQSSTNTTVSVPPPTKTESLELIRRSLDMASLNAEIAQRLEARGKYPRRKFISVTTREHKYAAYMEAWRVRIERIGNLNYPEEARRRKLTGTLILDVALRPDGSVSEVTVRRSSYHKVLDDAAIRIVMLAAPFAPFPEAIRREVDILHITRTWQF